MSLTSDAISTAPEALNNVPRFSKGRFDSNVLQEISQDINLDDREIVSLIFLFTDENTNISKVLEFLEAYPRNLSILKEYTNWEEKLLESLIILGNINAVRKLGFSINEVNVMKNRYVYREHNVSENLNRLVKSLYFVCDHLRRKETQNLITKVNKNLSSSVTIDNNKLWLELHILHWIQQQYISIHKDHFNLNNIISDLKSIGCLLPFNFEDWKIYRNEQDSSYTLCNDNSLSYRASNQNERYEKSKIPWAGKKKRLCIIINQINFTDKQLYETRRGSDKDEGNLTKTFRGCSFEVDTSQRDLTKQQMIAFLNSLDKNKKYKEYACIFLCIMSHGSYGEVVFSDDEKLKIEVIKEKFRCPNLQNVFKFIILQSCQGKQIGFIDRRLIEVEENLVTDGPKSLIGMDHFALFQATINGFVAFRELDKGSWFIQDICKVLQFSSPIMVKDFVTKVTDCVRNRRSKCTNYSGIDLMQLPELTSCVISVDYEMPKYQEVSDQ